MRDLDYSGPTQLVVLSFDPGELLLEGIREGIRRYDIQNGIVISGIGTLKTCRMHYVNHTGFPPEDVFYQLDKPLELVSVSGIIANGEPHLHITVGCRQEGVWAGHLEDGSEVLYLAEIAILKCNGMRMVREKDPRWGIRLLKPADSE